MMMTSLAQQLEIAEAEVARIKRQLAIAPCLAAGHRWKHIGGRNCGCEPSGYCSVPVHECTVCGDCDYGENAEAELTRKRCAKGEIDP